jgi:hypothetical protein
MYSTPSIFGWNAPFKILEPPSQPYFRPSAPTNSYEGLATQYQVWIPGCPSAFCSRDLLEIAKYVRVCNGMDLRVMAKEKTLVKSEVARSSPALCRAELLRCMTLLVYDDPFLLCRLFPLPQNQSSASRLSLGFMSGEGSRIYKGPDLRGRSRSWLVLQMAGTRGNWGGGGFWWLETIGFTRSFSFSPVPRAPRNLRQRLHSKKTRGRRGQELAKAWLRLCSAGRSRKTGFRHSSER